MSNPPNTSNAVCCEPAFFNLSASNANNSSADGSGATGAFAAIAAIFGGGGGKVIFPL